MISVKQLLVMHHSPTASMTRLTEAAVAGAHDPEIDGVDVVIRPALEATADDVLAADGYLLGTPANFGYMSGALKHFFDSTFLRIGGALDPSGAADESEGETNGRPFGVYVHGRYDTTGAVRSVTTERQDDLTMGRAKPGGRAAAKPRPSATKERVPASTIAALVSEGL